MTATEQAPMGVSALAKRVGVGPHTVRYYEKTGLLPPPKRTAAQYRRYDGTAVDRLLFIQGAQRLGLRLREIKSLLEVRDQGDCPCEEAAPMLRKHITDVDEEIRRLETLRAELSEMVEKLPAPDCPQPVPGTWTPRIERG